MLKKMILYIKMSSIKIYNHIDLLENKHIDDNMCSQICKIITDIVSFPFQKFRSYNHTHSKTIEDNIDPLSNKLN